MCKLNGKAYACIALFAAALLTSGCGDDGSPVTPEEDMAEFKALTTPENLIYNLVLSYADLNIIEYSRLLLNTDDGDYGKEYYWYFQEEDAISLGEEYLDREADITRTGNMFLAAMGIPSKPEHPVIDKLQLEIYDGIWISADSLWGEPCEDCWYTKRAYYIRIDIGDDTIIGDDYVEFYDVPVQEGDVTTYRIAFAMDVLN